MRQRAAVIPTTAGLTSLCKEISLNSDFQKPYLHINNCEGYWPSCLALPTNHHYVERGTKKEEKKIHLHMHDQQNADAFLCQHY